MGASKKQEFRRGRCSLVVLRSALTRAARRRRAAGEIVWKFSNLTASLPGRISFASTMLDTIYDVTGAPEACQIQNWDGGGEGTVTPALKVFFFFSLVANSQRTAPQRVTFACCRFEFDSCGIKKKLSCINKLVTPTRLATCIFARHSCASPPKRLRATIVR